LKSYSKDLSSVWGVILAYQIITIILISFFDPIYFLSPGFLFSRSLILCYLVVRLMIKTKFFSKYGILSDALFFYVLLAFFYGETAHLNTFFFPKIDPVISSWDQWIFNFQPSVLFSEILNQSFFSELMYFGYFSYYLTPLLSLIVIWKYKKSYFEEFSFLLLSAYFVYYMIFIFLPAEGPQFYFPVPFNQVESHGLFGTIVKLIQHYGEAPTAAFPSSHIGVSVIILILLFKNHKTLFKIFLPFCIILMFSTVYIKAHYFVDVIAGLVSAPVILLLNKHLYLKISSLSINMVYVNRN
jgi:membrane-associated phospholipid phosphatase